MIMIVFTSNYSACTSVIINYVHNSNDNGEVGWGYEYLPYLQSARSPDGSRCKRGLPVQFSVHFNHFQNGKFIKLT